MAAGITDKFAKAFNSTDPNVARVSSTRSVAATTLACDNLTGWPTDTAVDFVTYQLDTASAVVSGSLTVWRGIVSGNNIGTLTYISGTADAGNAINDYVEMVPTGYGYSKLVEGILVHADQDGTLKAGAVDGAAVLASDVVETAKIKDANVTTAKLANDAVTDDKLDFPRWYQEIGRASLSSATATLSVTVPARKYLRILASGGPSAASIAVYIQFNSDSGNNYAARYSTDGAADSTVTTSNAVAVAPLTYNASFRAILDVYNQATTIEKHIFFKGLRDDPGVAAAASRREGVMKWANTSAQITTITLTTLSANTFPVGTELIVLGHD